MYQFLYRTIFVVLALGFMPASARAQLILIGCTGSLTGQPQTTSRIVDIDIISGNATNPRDTGIFALAGIATQPGSGQLFGLTTAPSNAPNNSLVRIDVATGLMTLVGPTGLPLVVEGDLAFNPLNGLLYGLQDGGPSVTQRNFFSMNPMTGAATIIADLMPQGDFSALAFNPSGALFTIDSGPAGNSILYTVNPLNGAFINSTTMNMNLGSAVGMTFDPVTGIAYVADGGDAIANPTNLLFTLDTATGILSPAGSTNIEGGISGLSFASVPEPSSLFLVGTGSLALLRWMRS